MGLDMKGKREKKVLPKTRCQGSLVDLWQRREGEALNSCRDLSLG